MKKDYNNKLLGEGENKYRAYCPIIDEVIEAESKEEWEEKVQKKIKEQGK